MEEDSSNKSDVIAIEEPYDMIAKLAQVTFNKSKNSDSIKPHVFSVSKFKQLTRGISLFFRLMCCFLYVMQAFKFNQIPHIGPRDPPSYCRSIPYYSSYDSDIYFAGTIAGCKAEFIFIDSDLKMSSFKSNFDHFNCTNLCSSTNYSSDSICNKFDCKCAFSCNSTLLCGRKSYLDSIITNLIYDRTFVDELNEYNYFNLIFFPRRLEIYFIQAFFAILVLVVSICEKFYIYKKRMLWFKLVDLDCIIDFIIGFMYIATLAYTPCLKDIFIPLFLTAIPASKIVHELIYENDPYTRNSHFNTPLFHNMLSLVFRIITLLYITVCLLHYLERAHPDSKIENLFDSFWFTIITITTVGYGDIVVHTWMAKLTVIGLVILVILNLPNIIHDLISSYEASRRLSKVFSNSTDEHVVIVISQVRDNFLIDFLNEYYSNETNCTTTVILSATKPASTSFLNHKLKSPLWKKRIKLLIGSALSPMDLKRVALKRAKLVFVISDRHSESLIISDQETILRARSIHNYCPSLRLFVHILMPIHRFYLDFATKILCEGELKYAIFASNSICPGFSSFLSLILHTRSEDDNKGLTYSEDYNKCSATEMYEIKLKESKVFQSYEGSYFLYAAVQAHRSFNILLIGVKSSSNNRILLNPGAEYILEADDTCFYLSLKDESYIDITPEYKSKEALEFMCARMGLLHMLLYNVDVNQMMPNDGEAEGNIDTNSEYAKDLTIAHGIQKFKGAATNKHLTLNLPLLSPLTESVDNFEIPPNNLIEEIVPDITAAPKDDFEETTNYIHKNMRRFPSEMVALNLKTPIQERRNSVRQISKKLSRKFSFAGSIPKAQTPIAPKMYRDMTEKMEMTKLELNLTIEEQFKYKDRCNPSFLTEELATKIGYLPIRQYVGVTNFRCHIRRRRLDLCCLQFGWKSPCTRKDCITPFKPTREIYMPDLKLSQSLYPSKLKNVIIVCANLAGPQIFHFIVPLRSYHIQKEELLPILLLLHEIPDPLFLEVLAWLPHVYYMIGSESKPEDLIIAGVLNAKGVVICVGDSTNMDSLEPHMADASRINAALMVSRLFPRITFHIELVHRQNTQFLIGGHSKCSKDKRKKTQSRIIAGEFMDNPCFMSGQVFSPSLLETILYQSCSRDYIIDLIRIMLGLDQTHGCASMSKHIVTRKEALELKDYSRLMIRLALETKKLAFAIYRTDHKEMTEREIKRNQSKCDNSTEFIRETLKRLNIESEDNYDCSQKWEKQSYILPNPPANFKILEDDVILLFLPLSSNDMPRFSFSSIFSNIRMSVDETEEEVLVKPKLGEKLQHSFSMFMRKGSKDIPKISPCHVVDDIDV